VSHIQQCLEVRFEVFVAVLLRIPIFWHKKMYRWVMFPPLIVGTQCDRLLASLNPKAVFRGIVVKRQLLSVTSRKSSMLND